MYESGSAAHKIMTLPEYEELEERRREENEKKKREQAKINARTLRRNRLNSIKLLIGLVVFGSYFCSYIYLQNGITTSMKNIGTVSKELSNLRAQNAATESRIATTTSLDRIKKIATKKLGMVYANKGQIVYYTMDDEDYMSQYKEVLD